MASYLIRVAGRLSTRLVGAFPTLHAQVEPVQTTLTGPLPDQRTLTGVLNHLDELGVEIIEVIRLPEGGGGGAAVSGASSGGEASTVTSWPWPLPR